MPRKLIPIFLILLVDALAIAILVPLLPSLAGRFNAGAVVAGLLVSTYGISQIIASPVLGHLSDQFGRKRLLILCQVGTISGYLLMAYAPSLLILFLARVLQGVTGGTIIFARAYTIDFTQPAERAHAFGKLLMAISLGFLLGPFVAGQLVAFDSNLPLIVAASMVACGSLLAITLLPSGAAAASANKIAKGMINPLKGFSILFGNPKLRGVSTAAFLHYLCVFGFIYGYPIFAMRQLQWGERPVTLKEYGYLVLYLGILQIVVQVYLMKPILKFPEEF